MLSVILMEHIKNRLNLNAKQAATEAGSVVGFNEKTVRRYHNDFFENQGDFSVQLQGKYERHCVHHDEALNRKAAEWVREHAFVRGEPNMTAQSFCDWVNNSLLPSNHISPGRFLSAPPYIGFTIWDSSRSATKRDSISTVMSGKMLFGIASHFSRLSENSVSRTSPHLHAAMTPHKSDVKKMIIYHDESICNTNEGQTWMWGEEDRPAILPKTKGSGIMVSDFLEEHGGYLQLTDGEFEEAKQLFPNIEQNARQLLEYGADKETGDRFMKQVEIAANIADFKYERNNHTIVWLFDQSSCHRKFDLLAKNISVKDGGPRRVRDTVWAKQPQSMVTEDGVAKGLWTILSERGINTSNMRADDMRIVLSNHEDFANEKTIVEHYLHGRGHFTYFLPKFHCELNAIERVWAQAKVYSRAHTNFTLVKLRQIINPALDSVSVDLIRKYARKARDYEAAYRAGLNAGKGVEAAVKEYKSHRKIFNESFN